MKKSPPKNTDKKNHTVNEESENIKSEQLANLEKPKNSLNTSNTNNANIYAGPAVRKLAREFGIELSQVQPTGPKNRIQKEDLHLFVKSRLSATRKKIALSFLSLILIIQNGDQLRSKSFQSFRNLLLLTFIHLGSISRMLHNMMNVI
jgi:pyruvate/2-oxoglutarate dehydrogenase complex dihydrolipoamide acyltransferase (E2) component